MFRKADRAKTQQLFDFRVPNPVVFVVVENWNEDIEMRQQITRSNCGLESDRKIRTLSPLREFLIQRMARSTNFVTQRLQQSVQDIFSSATTDHPDPPVQSHRRIRPFLTPLALTSFFRNGCARNGD